jgi:5-methylcytosine-specific restriction endonuclease McrA
MSNRSYNSKLTRKLKKTINRLDRKRDIIASFLTSKGIELKDPTNYQEVCSEGQKYFSFIGKNYYRIPGGMHAALSNIIQRIPFKAKQSWFPTPPKFKKRTRIRLDSTTSSPTEREIQLFYRSYDWQKVRYATLIKYGKICMVCGSGPKQGIVIHVDHIKPLRKYWHLRLDPTNTQILCENCNHGKGNWDTTDHR